MANEHPTEGPLFASGAVLVPVVVRTTAYDAQRHRVCSECGHWLGQPTTARIPADRLIDAELREDGDRVPSHGWVCANHPGYRVFVPTHAEGPHEHALSTGWLGVRYRFADQVQRWVVVPEQEIERHV
jgi:hypothetical protein